MDLLDDDLFLEPAATNARVGGKFQPKVKPRPEKITSAPASSALPSAEKKVASVPTSSLETTQTGQPVGAADDKLGNLVGSSTDALGVSKTVESAMDDEVFLSDGTGSLELTKSSSKGNAAREDIGLDPPDDTHPEPVTKDARASGKSQPEINPRPGKDLSASAASDIYVADDTGDFANAMSNSVVCSTRENAEIYFGMDGLEDFVAQPTSGKDTRASELPAAEEPQALAETSQVVDDVMKDPLLEDDVPLAKMGFKRGKRKIPAVSDNAQKSGNSSALAEEEDCGKTLMQLRKCSARRLIDEPDEKAQDNSLNDAEAPSNSAAVEVEDGDGEWREEGGKSKKKRAPRKKPAVDSEKPARKRKKAIKETDQSADQPPKKFSHSTRRTRRQVDRALIETPEEDLDLTNMPIKDIIMFYLHKEKMEDKETKSKEKEAKSKKSSTDASTQNDVSHNEEEDMFDTERNSDFMDNQEDDKFEMTDPHFNYHTFMDKTSRSKWSKQDDELFYKCVRQFGIDLSMIQLLFPDRTRRQIKLKLKKEERQHPLRLTEAVQNRSKDHTQFQTIIEQIKKAKAEEDEEFYGSESIGVTGDEDAEDFNPENNDEATKPGGEETAGDNGNDPEAEEETEKVESPLQFDEIDDDFDVDDYKSEY